MIPIAIALLVYVMGYLGLRQPEIISGISEAKDNKKYERSGLTEEKARSIHDKLIRLMEKEKPYAESTIKLSQPCQDDFSNS